MAQVQELEGQRILPHNTAPAATWGSAGAAYEEISRGISDALEHCVNRLNPGRGAHILDVATGTGWTACRLADLGHTVTGVDFAEDKLAAARAKAQKRGYRITFDLGDAEALPYADASFDAVISTFGVMFASDQQKAAGELARVCRKGGTLALAVWTPDCNVFEMFKIIKTFMPKPVSAPPPSPFEWGDPKRIRQLLGGQFDLAFETATSFYRIPDGATAWEHFVNGYGPVRMLASKLSDEMRREFRQRFIDFHDGFKSELGICVPRDYLIAVGQRK
jgi:SAM-dependent methyltransferase